MSNVNSWLERTMTNLKCCLLLLGDLCQLNAANLEHRFNLFQSSTVGFVVDISPFLSFSRLHSRSLFSLEMWLFHQYKRSWHCYTLGQSHFARSHHSFDLKIGIFMQAILKQLGKETDIFDDDELQGHQKLQNLYNSTRETKVCHEVLFYNVDVPVCKSAKIEELWPYHRLSQSRDLQHFQREIVRGVESSVSTTKKQLEIGECGSAFFTGIFLELLLKMHNIGPCL